MLYHATIALVTLLGKARPFRPRGRTTCKFRKPHYSNFAPAENRNNNILSIDLSERQSFYNPLPHPFILHDPCRKIQEESEVYPVQIYSIVMVIFFPQGDLHTDWVLMSLLLPSSRKCSIFQRNFGLKSVSYSFLGRTSILEMRVPVQTTCSSFQCSQ